MNNLVDPFSKGLWIMTMIGNRDIVCMVDGSDETENIDEAEQLLRKELMEHRSICIATKKKYILYQIGFPVRTSDSKGFMPANMEVVGKHELMLELEKEFLTYANLQVVTFLSDLDTEDLNRLRKSVNNAEEGAKTHLRMKKSNIIAPGR